MAPDKHGLDVLIERMPDGAEGSEAWQRKEDAKAFAPLLKDLAPALFPEADQMRSVLAGVAQMGDRLRFMLEQVISTIPKDQLPEGIKNLEKIDKIRTEYFQQSGGHKVLAHRDAFAQVKAQLQAESDAKAAETEAAREDGAKDALKTERRQRQAGQSTPRNVSGPTRGGPGTPGKRTFQDINKAVEAGQDFSFA